MTLDGESNELRCENAPASNAAMYFSALDGLLIGHHSCHEALKRVLLFAATDAQARSR
jgi:hypothetical protein